MSDEKDLERMTELAKDIFDIAYKNDWPAEISARPNGHEGIAVNVWTDVETDDLVFTSAFEWYVVIPAHLDREDAHADPLLLSWFADQQDADIEASIADGRVARVTGTLEVLDDDAAGDS